MFLEANHMRIKGPVRGIGVTPHELWSGKKPIVAYIKSFGCKVYCFTDKKDKGGKLGVVRYKGVLVGYAGDNPSVRVWNPRNSTKGAGRGWSRSRL